jgi:AcrR family transcriptional regulator
VVREDHSVVGSREAMIRAGERLFGERGIEGVSLREVAAAAGQGNTSAVRYHFGSRDGLVAAIFSHRMARIDERRSALLADFDAEWAGQPLDVRLLVEAVVLPLAESIGHDGGVSWYARFLRQAAFGPGFDLFAAAAADHTRALRAAVESLDNRLSHLPEVIRRYRVLLAFELIVDALADHEASLAEGRAQMPKSLLVTQLVDATVAVLEAPVSDDTKSQLRRLRKQGA